jgi:hypothetical protein
MPMTSPLIGAISSQVWKPPVGVTPGAAGDATAPFALGTVVNAIAPRDVAQFCRVGATGINAGATAGIANGVTTTAATGNTWTNDSGVALVTGDYVFLSAAIVTTP